MFNRLIKNNNAAGGGCTDIVDNYDPFGGGFALYQLNGNANDVSGNYNGTASNVTYGTGVFGQAGIFNGSNSYIDLGSIVLGGTNNITVSMWVNPASSQGQYATIFDNEHETVGGFVIHQDSNNLNQYYLGWKPSPSQFVFSSNFSLTANSWSLLTVTIDSLGNYRIYVNAANVITGSGFTSLNTTISNPVKIGRYSANTFRYWNGSIDQVRIFNTALTPLEIEALYTEELCICDGTVDTLDILGDGSCIATYQLDGNANDLSGNYSGTPTNVSYGVGEFDLAGVFNGSSSGIKTPISYLNAKSTSSVSLWVKYTDTAAYKTLFQDWASNNNWNHNIIVNQPSTGNLRFFSAYGGVGGYVTFETSGLTLNDGNWHHIVGTVDVSTRVYKGYVDGVEVGSMTVSLNAWTGVTQNANIGNENGSSNFFNGSIDQVRIFNKALNSTEVTTLYNETACTKVCTSGTTNTLDILGDGSCIAAYPLDGSPADLSGNYNGIQGGNVTYPVGEFDLAAAFGGSGKGIDLPSNVPVAGQINCSVSLWFNVLNNTKKETLVRFANNDEVLLRINTNGTLDLLGVRQSNSTYISYTTAGSYNNGVWHYLVMTRESGSIKFYIDNVLDNTLSWNNTFITAANETAIGYDGFASASVLSGQIDQVRIFNKALSAGEVTTLYNETPCN